MDGSGVDASDQQRSGSEDGAASEEEIGRLVEAAIARAGDAFGALRTLGNVGSDRLRLRFRRALERAGGLAILWIATCLLVACGIVLVVTGLTEALRDLFAGHPGIGEIAAGLVLLSAALGWVKVRSARVERAETRRLEAKYDEIESKSGRRSDEH